MIRTREMESSAAVTNCSSFNCFKAETADVSGTKHGVKILSHPGRIWVPIWAVFVGLSGAEKSWRLMLSL